MSRIAVLTLSLSVISAGNLRAGAMAVGTAGAARNAVMRIFNAYPAQAALLGQALNSASSEDNMRLTSQLALACRSAPAIQAAPDAPAAVTEIQARRFAAGFFARLENEAASVADQRIVSQNLSALEANIGELLPVDVHQDLFVAAMLAKPRNIPDSAVLMSRAQGIAEVLAGTEKDAAGKDYVAAPMTDKDYLRISYQVAQRFGEDPNTQTGAIIVNNTGEIVVAGANRMPEGLAQLPERWQRPQKYDYVEHAERNAIYAAARNGIKTAGLTMYSPWLPCLACARAIIEAGIKVLVVHQSLTDWTPERWQAELKKSLDMLHEGGVETRLIKGLIGGVSIRFNDQIVTP